MHAGRAKVRFVSEGEAAAELGFIPPDVLPKIFGGTAELLPVDEAVVKWDLAKGAVPAKGPSKARRQCPHASKPCSPLACDSAADSGTLPDGGGGTHILSGG